MSYIWLTLLQWKLQISELCLWKNKDTSQKSGKPCQKSSFPPGLQFSLSVKCLSLFTVCVSGPTQLYRQVFQSLRHVPLFSGLPLSCRDGLCVGASLFARCMEPQCSSLQSSQTAVWPVLRARSVHSASLWLSKRRLLALVSLAFPPNWRRQ